MNEPWFDLELTRPAWLLGLAVVPLLVVYFVRSLVDFPRWQRVLSLAGRTAFVVLLVLALAGLTLLRPTNRQFVVFAVDRSLSIGEDSRDRADRFIAEAREGRGEHEMAVLEFAAEPGALRREVESASPGQAPEKDEQDENKGTDIARALEVAAAGVPPFYVPRIVLLSDGNQTNGDALKAALSTGMPVSTLLLKPRDEPEVQVAAVEVPAQVPQGEPFHVEVVVNATRGGAGRIAVYRDAYKVIDQEATLKPGENRFQFTQSIDGDARFTARVTGFEDTLLDNNSLFGLVSAAGPPRVLLVESDPNTARDLAWALEEQKITVHVRPARGMPESLAELQNYELIILSNVPATSLTARQMEVARLFVQELGGGLIMLGGDQSFGLGGYYKTTLEEILPVRSDFEKEKEKPSLAMMLVIDKSGSMGGEKIELAKDAAKSAVELLGPSDKIGVVAFDGEPYWVSEMHPCSDKGYVLDRIAGIAAGGGTSMAPAMEEAYLTLNQTPAKLKHVIIMTDGISEPGDFEGIAQQMASARITASTVGVGEGCDEALLEEIARIGNGRYYFTDDPQSIPQIFAKETMAASKSAINEQPFLPLVVRPTPALDGIDLETAPLLLGYVVTRPKPTAEVILATETGDPLLTWWRYGLGFSVAFTSDAKPRWAADWLSWPDFSRFWAQVVRHAMRQEEAKGVVVGVDRHGDRTTATLDAINPSGRFRNGAETALTVIDPRGRRSKLDLTQTAPGRYEGEFPTPEPGAYQLKFLQQEDGRVVSQPSRGLAVGYPDELRIRPANASLLERIARTTGGRFDPSPSEVFADNGRSARDATPLWPYLVIAAAILFVADVALRRIDFSLVLGRLGLGRSGTGRSRRHRRNSLLNGTSPVVQSARPERQAPPIHT